MGDFTLANPRNGLGLVDPNFSLPWLFLSHGFALQLGTENLASLGGWSYQIRPLSTLSFFTFLFSFLAFPQPATWPRMGSKFFSNFFLGSRWNPTTPYALPLKFLIFSLFSLSFLMLGFLRGKMAKVLLDFPNFGEQNDHPSSPIYRWWKFLKIVKKLLKKHKIAQWGGIGGRPIPWRTSKYYFPIFFNPKWCHNLVVGWCHHPKALFGFFFNMQSTFMLTQIFPILCSLIYSTVILYCSPKFICVKIDSIKFFLIFRSLFALYF